MSDVNQKEETSILSWVPKKEDWSKKAIEYSEFINIDFPKDEYLIDRLLPKNGVSMINGLPGSLKTWFYMYLCYCIVNDDRAFGKYESFTTNILIVNIDDPISMTQKRLKEIGITEDMGRNKIFIYHKMIFNISDYEGYPGVIEYARKKDIHLIIFDTIRHVHSGDENSSKDMDETMSALKDIAEQIDGAVLFTHHDAKDRNGRNAITAPSGSIAISGNCISSISLNRTKDDNIITIKQGKSKLDPAIKPFLAKFENCEGCFTFTPIEDKPKITESEASELLKAEFDIDPNPKATKTMIIKKILEDNKSIGITKVILESAFSNLVKDKIIEWDGITSQNNRKNYRLVIHTKE